MTLSRPRVALPYVVSHVEAGFERLCDYLTNPAENLLITLCRRHMRSRALFCGWHMKRPRPRSRANSPTHTSTCSLARPVTHTHTGRWREREREIKGERPISIHHLRKKTNGEMTLPRGRCLLPTVSHSQSSCVCTYLDALMCEFQLTCVCVLVLMSVCVVRQLCKSGQDVGPSSNVRRDEKRGKQWQRRDDRRERTGRHAAHFRFTSFSFLSLVLKIICSIVTWSCDERKASVCVIVPRTENPKLFL